MSRQPAYCLLTVLFLMLLVLAAPAMAARGATNQDSAADGRVTLDFREVELTDLIQTISELTGKNFLYDESVRGKVSIVSPDSMSIDEAYQLFLSVLSVKGFTIVPSGKVNKVVSTNTAKQANLPTQVNGQEHFSEQYITRLIRLQHLDASLIASTVLAPLLPATGSLVAYPPSNTLIITDSAANIERMLSIVRELDHPDVDGLLEVIRLQNSDAEEVAKICNDIFGQQNAPLTRSARRASAAAGPGPVIKVIPYKRSNSLIVTAGAEELALIKGLVERIDNVSDGKRSNINLYYLENADAATLATTLNEILTGIKAQPKQNAGEAKSPLSNTPVTITADRPTNSLIVNANPDDYDVLKEIIGKLDIKRKQVYVEALILELSMDATQRLGASLQGAGVVNGNGMAFGTSNLNTTQGTLGSLAPPQNATGTSVGTIPSLLNQTIEGMLLGGLFNPIKVTGLDGTVMNVPALSVLIDLAKKDTDINILSAPRLLTSDNEEAEIIVGSNVPIITGRLTDAGGNGNLAQSVTVERQDVALTLRFTPQVIEGDLVRLNVFQEITDLANSNVGTIDQVGPTFTKRMIRNTVLAQNGRTVVLGGLIGTNIQKTTSKVPLLGDIPLLGWLFKHEGTTERKTNLLVFINPTIIKNDQDLDRVTTRNSKAAKELMTDKVINALPEEFFGDSADKQVVDDTQPAEAGK